ncbi:winged helix-turn-helix domain-containing protein [Mediterraneibacter gnavus]|uniref:winged helix-turn-helix domain-containing protein n=1 Tax=Mediterraneibacter gnavus TaxID=33038 RepID=UPI0032191D02
MKYKDISLNPDTHEVLQREQVLDLTTKEYELLKYLLSNQKMILTREQILNHVWGKDYFGDVRTVDTHIRRLRKKLGESYIQTKIGTGYIMGDINE